MLRFLHCADFHIDSPFAGLGAAAREEMRAGLLAAFGAVIDRIITDEIPLCLIAGDLFDSANPAPGAVQAVAAGFARAKSCRFFISPGNHDPYTQDGVWAKTDFGENVFVFDTPALTAVHLTELDTTVYGYAFTGSELNRCPIADARPGGGGAHLLVAHADLASDSPYAPVSEQILGGSGMDYAALGHIHDGGVPHKIRNTLYAYSGCPQGRDFGECGEKGVLLGTLERDGAFTRCGAQFLPIARHRFFRHRADISGCTSDAEAAKVLLACAADGGWDENSAVRVTLTGNVSAGYHPDLPAIRAMVSGVGEVRLTDKSLPLADEDALRADPSLRGEFYRVLADDLHSEDPQTRERAELALKLGLCAMDGRSVDEI